MILEGGQKLKKKGFFGGGKGLKGLRLNKKGQLKFKSRKTGFFREIRNFFSIGGPLKILK